MSDSQDILVIDDGELEDVRELLDELRAPYDHVAKLAAGAPREPGRLLITTGPHAVSLGYRRTGPRSRGRPVWIAVIEDDSRSQRRLLLQSGFDYLVRRPYHPATLRMLVQGALYQGTTLRRGPRVAVGFEVTFRSGMRRQRAVLVDLSMGGCRLLTSQELQTGTPIAVQLPGQLAGGKWFYAKGTVVRTRPGNAEGGQPGETSLGIRFGKRTKEELRLLRQLIETLISGPASMERSTAASPSRRREPRGLYERDVLVFGDEERVLVGRDLSSGGMRVAPHPGLSQGDRVRLAIEGGGRLEPVVVSARVLRDDGERGLALRFEEIEGGGEARLEEIVRGLPAVEALESEDEAEPVVFSRMIPKLLRFAR